VRWLPLVHEVLQVAFGWHGCHLHEFQTVCGEFGDPADDDDWSQRADETAVALGQVAVGEKAKVVYVYDFGDDWRHDIVVEKITRRCPASVTRAAPVAGNRSWGRQRGNLGAQRRPREWQRQ
jgi:hypothetical protein